ncbi:MAG: DUF429 domain-containing protein [Desulfurococcaceae archaeon]|uniref:DUF429 domain-containing protein n=1 Tax=Staphylothermus marinus TaxID=2280 RepID=A0A7C4JM19_STAMA
MSDLLIRVAGLDLSGTINKPSGLAIVEEFEILYLDLLISDEDIIRVVKSYRPMVIAIDSPFSHAEGYREIDLVLKRMGFRVLPPGWRGMKLLVNRCLSIRRALEEIGITTIETHPNSCLKSSNCYTYEKLFSELNWLNYLGRSRDELDALICALVALFYVRNKAIKVEASDGTIYLLPKICF